MGRLDLIQVLLVIGIDLLHSGLHGLPGAGVLAGKENPETGSNQQPDQADHHDNQDHDPAAGNDGRNQRLGCGDDGFYRCCGGLGCNLDSMSGGNGSGTGGAGSNHGRPGRSLGCPLGSLGRLLAGLDAGFSGLFRRLDGFAGSFHRPLGRGRSLLDGFAAPVYGFDGFLATFQGPDGSAFLPDRLGWLGDGIRRLPPSTAWSGLAGLPRRLFLCLFFRLFRCGLALLDFLLDLGDVLPGGLNRLAALFIKLVDHFMGRVIHPSGKTVRRILARGTFLRI